MIGAGVRLYIFARGGANLGYLKKRWGGGGASANNFSGSTGRQC